MTCFSFHKGYGQIPNFRVISPIPGSIIQNGNLFVVISFSEELKIRREEIKIILDKTVLNLNPKISQNGISFLVENTLSDGKHHLEILLKTLDEPVKLQRINFDFHVNLIKSVDTLNSKSPTQKKVYQSSISGNITADNRSEFLKGPGKSLRQEPSFTRTLGVNLDSRVKNAHIPVRFFTTTDNFSQIQNRNFFQIGFINKEYDISIGDINPSMDRFILSGVRMRGIKTVLKQGSGSAQFYYGILNDKVEGMIYKYEQGMGQIPPNFLNDSVYIIPGTFKRWMMAGRIEMGTKKDNFKFGFHGFKAKDEINSINYGVSPKDNIAAGMDFMAKFFKKSLIFNFGGAATVITNDISTGPIDKKHIDTTFKTDFPFDPVSFEKYIIINASTTPLNPKNLDFTAYFGSLMYSNKFQRFLFEYRRNGPQFVSLGNPFLRNNYAGFIIDERVWLWKKRISLTTNYREFTNNLDQSLISTMHTKIIGASAFLIQGKKFPSLMLNYSLQSRNSEQAVSDFARINDNFNNIGANLNYFKTFWGLNHNFRLNYNQTKRIDFIRPEGETNFYSLILGIGEEFSEKFSINADAGKTLIQNFEKKKIADLLTYSGSIKWQIKAQKLYTQVSFSNNINAATIYNHETRLFSVIGRMGVKIYKVLTLDAEYAYQPFQNKFNPMNNYFEQYIYVRCSYDFNTK